MVFSASRSTGLVIEVQDLERAITLLERTESKMHHTFSGIGQSDIAALLSKMLAILITRKEILYSELLRIPDIMQNADDATTKRAIQTLIAQKVVKLEKVIEGNKYIDAKIIYLGKSKKDSPLHGAKG